MFLSFTYPNVTFSTFFLSSDITKQLLLSNTKHYDQKISKYMLKHIKLKKNNKIKCVVFLSFSLCFDCLCVYCDGILSM